MLSRCRALASAFVLCSPFAARATEFVVDTRAAVASDHNPGTADKPLKTISAAAAQVKAGDHVLIHEGSYRETVIVKASGTEERPIVFESVTNERAVIKGSDILEGWEKDEGQVWKVKLPALPVRGEDGKSASFWNTNDIRQVFTRDSSSLEAQRLRGVTNRAEMEAGTFFCEREQDTLYLWLEDSSSPLQHPPEVARRGAWLCLYGSHIIVRGIEMRHASTTAIANWPACNIYGEDNTIDHCVISWGDFAGIGLSGKGNHLRHSIITCQGACGVGGTGDGHLIEGCRIIFNNISRYDPDWHAGGAKLIPNFGHSSILHNEFAHNLGPGLWLDGNCNHNVIDGNYCHDNEGPGIMVEISTNNLITNNVAASNRNFLSGSYRADTGKQSLVFKSEPRVTPSRLFKAYHAGDGRGIYVSSSPQTRVINNTTYLNEGEGICVEGPARGEASTRDEVVTNNISAFNHGSQLTINLEARDDRGSTVSDYNLLFSVGAVLAKNGWQGDSTYDLSQWRKSSGQDQHSLDADPQFAMVAMDDFRLLETSPALNGGRPMPENDHDFFGHSRGKEAISIGAFEGPAKIYPLPLTRQIMASLPCLP